MTARCNRRVAMRKARLQASPRIGALLKHFVMRQIQLRLFSPTGILPPIQLTPAIGCGAGSFITGLQASRSAKLASTNRHVFLEGTPKMASLFLLISLKHQA